MASTKPASVNAWRQTNLAFEYPPERGRVLVTDLPPNLVDSIDARFEHLLGFLELRGEAAGIIAAQRHAPEVQKMIREISEKTGDPVEEIEDRIFERVRTNVLPTASTSTMRAPNAAVAAYRAKLNGSD